MVKEPVGEASPAEEYETQQAGHPDNSVSFPIVGIGASAGGLEALEQFFRYVPIDSGMAYVVVQHLSPDYKSVMDELLGRVTSLPVTMISDGAEVQPNMVYLLPPKNEVILSEGKLLLAERAPGYELNFPIDHFFRSLAQEAGSLAIGVILSGTGNDGSRGVCDIHDAGGMILSQNDDSAKFNGMPRACRETGVVNLELAPEEMGAAIVNRYSQYKDKSPQTRGKLEVLDGPMYTVFHLLKKHCLVDFADYKTTTISRRIHRRILLSGIDNLSAYVELLKTSPDEVERLYKDLLIGVTGFFRDKDVFDQIEREVIPQLMGRLKPEDEFRAWCVAVATGEEAYSLAILLSEYQERHQESRPVRIFASDIHRDSLNKAARGIYQLESLAGISEERLDRYFEHRSDGYHISPELRKMVVFVPHNVIKDAPFTRLDLITCRNMLIYVAPPSQKKVLSLFHFALKRNGILCLGPSETTGELSDEFQVIDERTKIFLKRREIPLPANMRLPISVSPMPLTTSSSPMSALAHAIPIRELVSTYDRLLDDFMPTSVLIDGRRNILHTFGGGSNFLRHRDGRLSKDILENIPESLRSPVSSALRKVQKERRAVTITKLRVSDSEKIDHLNLEIRPVGEFRDTEERFLVIFHLQTPPPVQEEAEQVDGREYPNEELELLERELQHTRDSLQAMIEELQTTNEELQSANEQLIASNEELQSTNEELHSVNEELYTVNAEHQRKIDELTELTDDMDNLLNSTNVHTIFLDSELRIRRFTPGVAGTFNLIPQDVGRRIDSFTYNILDDHLIYKIKHVLETGEPLEREVRDRAENWFLMRMQPYLTRGKTDGIVITLIDVSSLKQAERKLAELSEIVEHSDDAIFRIGMNGAITTWNRGAERLFGYEPEEILGSHVSRLSPPEISEESSQMLKRLEKGVSTDMVETRCCCRDGKLIDVSLTASPIRNEDGHIVGASEIVRDITIRKRAEQEVRESVRHRDQFLAMLSHELRNPLAAVLNASGLMNEPNVGDAAISEAKEVISNNVFHLARILDDLLDVSRYTHNKVSLHLGVVNMNSLALDVIECVRHMIDSKQQQLTINIPEDVVYVEGDSGRLQQAQVNLLVNASKYTSEKGNLEYSLKLEDGMAVITVEDDGEGIDPSLLPRVFEPFVQEEQALERAQGGMGLGLPLVRMIVESHGGTIRADSRGRNQGSSFTVRLATTTKRPEVKSVQQMRTNWGRRILVIDDNENIRRMLGKTLQLKGFEVETAADGNRGLDAFLDFRPDVSIIDIGLPDINGYELAKVIRGKPDFKNVFLVAVTGYGRDSDQQKAMDAGFDFHIVKPVDPDELLQAISIRHPNSDAQNPAEKKMMDRQRVEEIGHNP